jgi:hypothetical protein
MKTANFITNEFEMSTNMIKCQVTSHTTRQFANNQNVLNQAEIKAMKEEQKRLEEEIEKERKNEEGSLKIINNLKQHKQKQKKKQIEDTKFDHTKKTKLEKAKEYDKTLAKNIKKVETSIMESEPIQIQTFKAEYPNNRIETKINYETFSFNDLANEEPEKETPKEMEKRRDILTSKTTVNLRHELDSIIKEKLLNKNPTEEQSATEELAKNIDNIKEFRKKGFITVDNTKSDSIKNSQKETKVKVQKQNELEKRRYTKALRNIMIEKFKEKSIVIPNICSCGQLQKKLETLLENKNVSVYSIMNIECANNCIYYNNSEDYHKAISDIISSVKNIKFDNFHN